jgi:hypothetical protein
MDYFTSLAPAQMLLLGVLPVGIAHQLFSGRFRALARDIQHTSEVLEGAPQPATTNSLLLRQSRTTARWWLGQLPRLRALVLTLAACVGVWLRALYLSALFAPAALLAPAALGAAGAAVPRLRAAWMQLVCWSLERGGALFIKWAQWAATRPGGYGWVLWHQFGFCSPKRVLRCIPGAMQLIGQGIALLHDASR